MVAPDSEPVLSSVRAFFQDLSATYQALNLGRHCPLSRGGLREGLLRVSAQGPPPETPGGTNAEDDWFAGLGEGPLGTRLRLFARACRMQLGESSLRHCLVGPSNCTPTDCVGDGHLWASALRVCRGKCLCTRAR